MFTEDFQNRRGVAAEVQHEKTDSHRRRNGRRQDHGLPEAQTAAGSLGLSGRRLVLGHGAVSRHRRGEGHGHGQHRRGAEQSAPLSGFRKRAVLLVLPEREIAEALLARLPLEGVRVHRFTLTLTEEALVARLRGDIARGLRGEDIIPSALDRLKRCSAAGGELLDTTRLSPDEVAEEIAARVKAARKGDENA